VLTPNWALLPRLGTVARTLSLSMPFPASTVLQPSRPPFLLQVMLPYLQRLNLEDKLIEFGVIKGGDDGGRRQSLDSNAVPGSLMAAAGRCSLKTPRKVHYWSYTTFPRSAVLYQQTVQLC
jgi:hypothetical protein